jgi:hypothetical protein
MQVTFLVDRNIFLIKVPKILGIYESLNYFILSN